MDPIRITKVDHIHRYTPDKFEAAAWYGKLFGFEILEAQRPNAEKYRRAPLDVANADQSVILALFSTAKSELMGSTATVALRVTPEDFVRLVEHSEELDIVKRDGTRLTKADIIHHAATGDQSVYFVDPWGNSIEIIAQCTKDTTERLGAGKSFYPEDVDEIT
jgi:catechol 2,3-dioxygenase-like lactoylglutathione lyase family enzyme